MTEDEFIQTLERLTRDRHQEWRLVRNKYAGGAYQIRTEMDGRNCCPLTFVFGGDRPSDLTPAIESGGARLVGSVINAADYGEGQGGLRDRLLAACGLADKARRKKTKAV